MAHIQGIFILARLYYLAIFTSESLLCCIIFCEIKKKKKPLDIAEYSLNREIQNYQPGVHCMIGFSIIRLSSSLKALESKSKRLTNCSHGSQENTKALLFNRKVTIQKLTHKSGKSIYLLISLFPCLTKQLHSWVASR